MSKIYFILLFVLNTSLIIGQQTEKEQTHWTTKGIVSFNLGQTALNN